MTVGKLVKKVLQKHFGIGPITFAFALLVMYAHDILTISHTDDLWFVAMVFIMSIIVSRISLMCLEVMGW